MYKLYMDKVLYPVTPSKIQMKIKNQNKTANLMNDEEINIIRSPGLTEITFELLLPNSRYPFAQYKDKKYKPASYYLDLLEKLKVNKKAFVFKILRKNFYDTNITCTLEEYTITESSDNGTDVNVSIKLKQYMKYGTIVKKVTIKENTSKVTSTTNRDNSSKKVPKTYVVKKGDTLWGIAKKFLGNGAKCWNLAKINKISNPNKIYVGQKLIIQDVKASKAPKTSKHKVTPKKNTTKKSNNMSNSTSKKKSNSRANTSTSSTSLAGISLVLDNYYNATKKTNPKPTGSVHGGSSNGVTSSSSKYSSTGGGGSSHGGGSGF